MLPFVYPLLWNHMFVMLSEGFVSVSASKAVGQPAANAPRTTQFNISTTGSIVSKTCTSCCIAGKKTAHLDSEIWLHSLHVLKVNPGDSHLRKGTYGLHWGTDLLAFQEKTTTCSRKDDATWLTCLALQLLRLLAMALLSAELAFMGLGVVGLE